MTVRLHRGDLPDLSRYTDQVAIDTETMGLHPYRDRLCVVQLSNGDGSADVVQIPKDHGKGPADAPNLKDLLGELLNVDLSKQQQSSDWGAQTLSEAQLAYAASDVLHLHGLRERLDVMLAREDRTALAQACFDFLPTRARLDLDGWDTEDIFAHS